MRSLGLLSVREEKSERQNIRRRSVFLKEEFHSGISVAVAEFSASAEKIRKMSKWKKTCLKKKAKRFLRRHGAEGVAMTLACSEAFGQVGGVSTIQRGILPTEMADAVRYALSFFREETLGQAAWFLDRQCQVVDLSLLGEVSQRVRYLGLVTLERERAERLEEELCEEYGVALTVQSNHVPLPRDEIFVADMDRGQVRVGKEYSIDGREFSLDLHGYSVDLPALVQEFPGLCEKLFPLAWLSGKKRLTR